MKRKDKQNVEKCVIWGTFLPFKKNKIIKLAISRPRHFLGGHSEQHFCEKCYNPPKQIAI